jgi:hypothetical protein
MDWVVDSCVLLAVACRTRSGDCVRRNSLEFEGLLSWNPDHFGPWFPVLMLAY